MATLAEMYVQGVSTRKVKAITEELCGHAFSASAISAINEASGREPRRLCRTPPSPRPFPYLILDARYEKVREGGIVSSQAVLIAIGVDWDGRRQILAVEMANRESRSSWKDFLLGLRRRGLTGVEFVVADDHAGLRIQPSARSCPKPPSSAVMCTSSAPPSTTCRVRPMTIACRNCAGFTLTDPLDRGGSLGPRCLDRQMGRPLPQTCWMGRGDPSRRPSLSTGLPRQHHKHLKSTNMLERLNEEIRRRTYVVRIFPNSDACRRLVRALAVETHENWLEAHRYPPQHA